MLGQADDQRGIISRAVEHIFTHISNDKKYQYTVQIACLQIYMEIVRLHIFFGHLCCSEGLKLIRTRVFSPSI